MTEAMSSYSKCQNLTDLYLEGSWVLSIRAIPTKLEMMLDFALREGHANYVSPSSGEQYCYKRGTLVFTPIRELHWVDQGRQPAVDASGEMDYGSLDVVEFNATAWHLDGDFGTISVLSPPPTVEWNGIAP